MIRCDNCEWTGLETDAREIEEYFQRVTPGCTTPSAQCPECGALCYPVEKPWWTVIVHDRGACLVGLVEDAKDSTEAVCKALDLFPKPPMALAGISHSNVLCVIRGKHQIENPRVWNGPRTHIKAHETHQA